MRNWADNLTENGRAPAPGVRPSPAAAMSEPGEGLEGCDALRPPSLAAAGDGRTPFACAAAFPSGGVSVLCLVLSLAFLLSTLPTAAAGFSAALDRDTIALGESATLTLTYQGGSPSEPPVLPTVPNLSIHFRSESRQTQVFNGRFSSAVVHFYAVTPSQVGQYIIPALSVKIDNRTFTSRPLQLNVTKSDSRLAQIAFVTLTVPKQEAFVGEAIVCEMSLFAQGGELKQPPQMRGEGITISTNLSSDRTVQVQTNNNLYQRLTCRTPITFAKAGPIQLQAADCILDVRMRRPSGRRDPFGFDDFFSEVETRRLTLSSDPVTVQVLPLPTTNVPPNFTGAVGEFTLAASITTNVVSAGDPLTLTVQIRGRGNLENLSLTSPSTWQQFKTYAPISRTETTDEFGLVGTRTFEQVLIPEGPDVREIPAVTFSYFNPAPRAYRSLTHPAIPITVRPSTAPAVQSILTATPGAGREPAQDATQIVHIKNRLGTLAMARTPLLTRPWFLLLQLLPLLGWVAISLWHQRREAFRRDPRLQRRQQVARHIRLGLAQLRQQAAANQADAFYATLFHLLQEQIGERLELPASAITVETVENRLRPAGLPPPALASLQELFALCDQARFAPQPARGELSAWIPRVEAVLDELSTFEPHGKP